MKIIVNGKEIPALPGSQVRDILTAVLSKDDTPNSFIARLLIDGKEVPIDSDEISTRLVSEIQTLEVEINSMDESLNKNIANAQDYLTRLLPGIEKAAELFRNENEVEANKFFVRIIDGIDWLSQVLQVVVAAQGLNAEELRIDGKSMKDRHDLLIDLTGKMVEANKNKDWVLLADLLEYEILPYYEEWEGLLPQLILDSSKDSSN